MNNLIKIIKEYESLAIAFSGGIDSSVLLFLAKKVLKEKVIAVTSFSKIHKEKDLKFTKSFTKKFNIKHIIIETGEIEHKDFKANNINRCYICKKLLFEKIKKKVEKMDIGNIAHGENIDDLKKIRPGFKAAEEAGIKAPFIAAGLDKKKIRYIAKDIGLDWNKPSESCLATRIPYNTEITATALKKIEYAEKILADIGILKSRVRYYEKIAKIETTDDYAELLVNNKKKVKEEFELIGFNYVIFPVFYF